MSAKVEDGLSYHKDIFLRKFPVNKDQTGGGWLLNRDLLGFYDSLDIGEGWGWNGRYEDEYKRATLVAPLPILFWEK